PVKHGPGRGPEYRAVGTRRLEPQATGRRGQSYAAGDRGTGCLDGRRLHRRRAAFRAVRPEAVFVVVISQPGLASFGSRPPTGSYLGHAGPRTGAETPDHPEG